MIDNAIRKEVYDGDGSTVEWAIPFDYSDAKQVKLYTITDDVETEITTNFSINNNVITYPVNGAPVPEGTKVLVIRKTPLKQLESSAETPFTSADVERALDKLTCEVQEVKEDVDRALKSPEWSKESAGDLLKQVEQKVETLESAVSTKQDILVSGANIKTVNNQSLLGSGNIVIYEDIANNIEEHNISPIAHQDIRTAIETLQLVQWFDTLPESGERKYIYAVPREETDTEGKRIAALYLWDGSAWRGVGAFSLNIDPDTLATKTELAGYLPLSGGTLSGNLVVRKANPEINIKSYGYQSTLKLDNSEKYDGSSSAIYNIACLEKQLYIYRSDRGTANSILIDAGGNLARRTPSGNFLFLTTASKGVANGLAGLDANGKVPLSQLPDNIGGGAPTLKWYKNNTGSTVTIDDTSSASLVKVYKNGVLLEPEEDYSISGTTLTLTTELISTDKITTEVF